MPPLDFPNAPTTGQIYTSADGSTAWMWDGVKWTDGAGASSGGGSGTVTNIATTGPGITGGPITNAGTLAVQWNAGTASTIGTGLSLSGGTLSSTVSGGLVDAPNDGTLYARKSAAWSHPAFSDLTGTATYAQLPNEVQQVPLSFPFAGKPAASAVVNVPMPWALTIPSGLTGTVVYSGTQTTSNAVFTVSKISGGSTTTLGAVTITSTSHTSATLSGAGGSLAAGDTLQIVAPGTQDATLAEIGITVLAARV